MKRFRLSIFSILIIILPLPLTAQNWTLIWEDNFDGTEIDTTKWSFQIGDGCPDLCDWGNAELQDYRRENATIADGLLSLTAKKENYMGSEYTSARLRTINKGDWKYGRFEISARVPEGKGFWPAIWLLSTEEYYGGWAASGEIDIMENTGDRPDKIFGTIHYGGPYPLNTFTSTDFILAANEPSFADTFHVFAVEWEYDQIRWYVDGTLYATRAFWYSTGGPFPAPFDRDFHLLLNLAVGGNLPGSPDQSTVFPQSLVIDYVRVYEAQNQVPSVVITSPLDSAVFAPGSNITITADASDTDGTVKKVQFLQGSAILGETTESPYEFTVENVSSGCYSMIVNAIDNYGRSSFDTVKITVGECGQAPYLMIPSAIPGRIESENYDIGGQNIAYNDLDPGLNNGNALGNEYRTGEGVDIENCRDNGFGQNISWIEDGEWVEYLIDVQETGIYRAYFRVASEQGGGSLHLEFGSVDKTGTINIGSTGGAQEWITIRSQGIELDVGIDTLRVFMDKGGFNLNHFEFIQDTTDVSGIVIFDDFEDGNASDWQFFPGTNAGGSGQVTSDRPAEGSYYFGTDWSGQGTTSNFYGGFFKNVADTAQLDLPDDPWINVYVYHESAATTVESYTLEITIREDTDGNGWTNGLEDSKRLDTLFNTSDFNDRWILVSVPVSDLIDIGTGGNGFFDGRLDECVVVISQVSGDNPSNISVDIDFIAFTSGGPIPVEIFDDFEDGNASDWQFFSGNNANGSGQIESDRPAEGSYYFSTDWSGQGTASNFYGGFFKNLDETAQLSLPDDPWINVYVYHESAATTVESYTLEITIREDTDGNGWTNGLEDSKRLDTVFTMSDFNDQWMLISASVSGLIDLGTGGNGFFDGKLDEIVVVISQVIGDNPSSVSVDLDFIAFSSGGPPPLVTTLEEFDEVSQKPNGFFLGLAYPNPFNPTTTITYNLAKPGDVQLDVFSILGQKVRTIVNNYQSAGTYKVQFEPEDLASGIYLYRLKAGNYVKVRKMIFIR